MHVTLGRIDSIEIALMNVATLCNKGSEIKFEVRQAGKIALLRQETLSRIKQKYLDVRRMTLLSCFLQQLIQN